MAYSYSRISTYENCPRRFKYHYVDKIESYEDVEAFILGRAVHKGIELNSVDKAIDYLKKEAGVWGDKWVNEEIKIREILPKVLKSMEKYTNASHEVEVKDKDNYFNGFIDMIDKEGNIYDFKYCSTSTARRLDGRQLNFYRYLARVFLQLDIKKMFYVIIPKVNIRQKKTETLSAFRQRLIAECKEVRPYIQEVEYDPSAIEWFLDTIKKIESDKAFEKRESEQCRLCPYRVHCQESEVETMDEKKQVPGTQDPKSGTQTMKVGQMGVESETKAVENGTSSLLPKAERKARDKSSKIKMWIYGAPFSGKTTFANMADMPLFLNTDGNVKYIDAPAIIIKDGRKQIEGSRMSKKVWGWESFKSVIDELSTNTGGYDTIVVDLAEGIYELCRSCVCAERGWSHESDDSLKSWDIIRKEYLDTMRKLTTMDLNVILLSHEDTSRDFMARNGSATTLIKPNIQDKLAKQLAGMVDIVARMVVRDGAHVLTFAQEENTFGGGRLELEKKELPVSQKTGWADFKKLIKGEE